MSNSYRYKDEPNNTKCKVCNEPTWSRKGVFTMFHGKGNYWNDCDKKEPISYFDIKGGVICYKCWADYCWLD